MSVAASVAGGVNGLKRSVAISCAAPAPLPSASYQSSPLEVL
jgi:hypothetical protein